MKRTIIGGVVGGVVLFIWGALTHMVFPLWEKAVLAIPGEEGVVGAMRGAIREPGVYLFPGADMSLKLSKEEKDAWAVKLKAGPRGLLVYRPDGAEPMSPQQLGSEAASNMLAALLVALALAGLRGGYVTRVLVSALFGAVAWLSISASYYIWYGFSREFSHAELIEQVGGWLVVGLVMAAIVKRPSVASKA